MLTINNLYYSINDNIIINNITLTINCYKIICLSGESGSGKTTLLKIIAGFIKPQFGEIFINNTCVLSPNTFLPPNQRNVSFSFQDDGLWPHLNIENHFNISWNMQTFRDYTDFQNKLISNLKLKNLLNRYPHQLSGGESHRVSIARALGVNKNIYLLDEPLAHLDSSNKIKVLETISEFISFFPGKLIIIASHDPITLEIPTSCTFEKYMLESGKIISLD